VSISFEAWKEVQVAPTKHVVSVINPKAGIKSEPVSTRWLRTMVHPQRKASVPHVRFLDDGKKLFVAGYPSGVETFAGTVEGRETAAETLLWDLKSGRATSVAQGRCNGDVLDGRKARGRCGDVGRGRGLAAYRRC
jgi:hypothetical protein